MPSFMWQRVPKAILGCPDTEHNGSVCASKTVIMIFLKCNDVMKKERAGFIYNLISFYSQCSHMSYF